MTAKRMALLFAPLVAGGLFLAIRSPEPDGNRHTPSPPKIPRSAREDRNSQPPAPREAELLTLRELAQRNPERAAARARDADARAEVAAAWAGRDPDAASDWAESLEPSARDAALEIIATEMDDRRKALAVAGRIGGPARRGRTIGFLLAQDSAAEPDRVLSWLETTEEPETVRLAVERQALAALAEHAPRRVATWIGKGHAADTADAAAATVRRWSQQDPAATARWVVRFPDPGLRRHAMKPLVAQWTRDDPEASRAWMESLSPGAVRDDACAAYALALGAGKPAEAARWARRIECPVLLSRTLQRLPE